MSRKQNPTIARLKTMVKNHHSHALRDTSRIIKYGASGFKRNIWLSMAATIVMTFTLVVLFVTLVASLVLSSTAETMKSKIDITVFLKPGTTEETLSELAGIMKEDKNVREVSTATSEVEFARFLDETKQDADEELLATLTDKEMQAIMLKNMQATMRIRVYDSSDLSSIKTTVSTNEIFIQNLDTDKAPTYNTNDTTISTITSWASMAKTGGLILGAIFLVITILVIFNTIRMAIFSRREEIYMEKLVGADNHFIRGPFLVEAMMSGLIAGILASAIGFSTYHFTAPAIEEYGIDMTAAAFLETNQAIFVVLVFLFGGMLIGFIASRLAVRKYLTK